MKPLKVQKIEHGPCTVLTIGGKHQQVLRGQRLIHAECDPDTFEWIAELNERVVNHLMDIEQAREEFRRLGLPPDFKWASRPGEPFALGDLLAIERTVRTITRRITTPAEAVQ